MYTLLDVLLLLKKRPPPTPPKMAEVSADEKVSGIDLCTTSIGNTRVFAVSNYIFLSQKKQENKAPDKEAIMKATAGLPTRHTDRTVTQHNIRDVSLFLDR